MSYSELYNLFHGRCASVTARRPVLKSVSQIKRLQEQRDRLVIAFLKHDGIFHALLTDQEVCAKVREAYQNNTVVAFTYDAKLRILSVP
jgi:hypothetical protein